ncbi:hypothetical protein [Nitrosopumilus sp.]|uniref:hypothetical protein n=1 Tax=Nitrosopumilus sp. TaxID=2024843 RepID=UPI00292DD22D|nr:hypothetical protein [Nitrosopumilus sp.]
MLISLNYSAIVDFYTYSVPLNKFTVEQVGYSEDPNRFQRISQQGDSTCFVTPSSNEYCYEKPKGNKEFRFSHPAGSNGINGEMHFDPANNAKGYYTMSSITPISNNTGIITFSNKCHDYSDESMSQWQFTEDFEFTRTIEKYDTFVTLFSNNGKYVEIIRYMGIITVDELDYVATWHVGAYLAKKLHAASRNYTIQLWP